MTTNETMAQPAPTTDATTLESGAASSPQATTTTYVVTKSTVFSLNVIIICCAVVVLAVIGFLVYRRRQKTKTSNEMIPGFASMGEGHSSQGGKGGGTLSSNNTVGTMHTAQSAGGSTLGSSGAVLGSQPSGASSLSSVKTTETWNDPMIVALRVPFEKVIVGRLISRGAFGEVYMGTYLESRVAIKCLLPEHRKDLGQINYFLSEIKLVASLDHERVVSCLGVAWNSLSDICMVTEYMAGGDLRSALSRFDQERRPRGFDEDKVRCALHVAHALTYLHSLQPVMIHRDLKSRNILLTEQFDAKLTDFGTTREYRAQTMTGGVGTSFWMAPEIMLMDRYDEKADIFSFGVVLSELDTHQLPYADAVALNGARLPETAILQMVATGRLSVSFSREADAELVVLGRDCVSVDPRDRPTAAEVLHRVHTILQWNYTVHHV